jgi:hypothetical protein
MSSVVAYLDAGKSYGKGEASAAGRFYSGERERVLAMIPHVGVGRPTDGRSSGDAARRLLPCFGWTHAWA